MSTRIGYLLTLFPKLSESFVLNEVVELRRRGVEIVPISLERSTRLEEKRHGAAAEVADDVIYAVDGFPFRHAAALAYWLLRRPLDVVRLALASLRHPAPRGESKAARLALALVTARLVREHGIGHLHAHWSYPADVALLVSRFVGVPYSFTAHAHDIFEDVALYDAAGFSFADRLRTAEFVVACTEHNAETLRGLSAPELHDRVHTAYHGLDPDRFRREEPAGADPPVLLSVGRFVRYKGFDVVVRACERLRREGRPIECWLVGPSGSQTEPVRRQIADAGLTDVVRILGPKTHEELLELYRRASVYVNASDPEGEYGVANVIVEALALELPTVATLRPQTAEYLEDGVNALLVPYGDDAALAAAVARILDDRALGARLAAEGRRRVEECFDIACTADRLAALFRRLPARRAPLEEAA